MGTREELVESFSKLGYGNQPDTSRLLGMIVALAGEVFVMKAQSEVLRRALAASGSVDAQRLAAEASGDAMQTWLATEEREFTRALLGPFMEGDTALNATAGMARS